MKEDKEALEKIAGCISANFYSTQSDLEVAAKVLLLVQELGYRKLPEKTQSIVEQRFGAVVGKYGLPKDKPPLLSDEEMAEAVRGEWNATHWRVAQAQREADIKWYEL